jgi:hypothetical protein
MPRRNRISQPSDVSVESVQRAADASPGYRCSQGGVDALHRDRRGEVDLRVQPSRSGTPDRENRGHRAPPVVEHPKDCRYSISAAPPLAREQPMPPQTWSAPSSSHLVGPATRAARGIFRRI